MNIEIKNRISDIVNNRIPPKYKKSKVGIIPKDWSSQSLIELCHINVENLNGSTDENYEFKYYDLSSVDNGKIYHPTEAILYGEAPSRARRIFRKNSILMSTVRPYLKGFGIVNFDCNNCIASTGFAVLDSKLHEDAKFVYYNLFSHNIEKQIYSLLVGSNYPAINNNDVEELRIPYPNSSLEKILIGEILSTWDKAIELKEQLIEEKKTQKKGLLRKLITGEVRLPGFEREWEEVRIGSVLKERVETKCDNLELLAITGKNGIVKRTEVDIKDNSSEDKSKYKRICPGDIGYNTMRMWQGVSAVSEYEGIVSPAYTILKPTEKVDSYFMGYLFKLPKMINVFWRHSQGLVDDTLNLKYSNLKNIKVRIPKDVQEQKAIANVLLTLDQSINYMEQELEALKLQKKGLMQLLLTGIVRVGTEAKINRK